MKKLVQVIAVGLLCVGAAVGAVFLVLAATNPDRQTSHRPGRSTPPTSVTPAAANDPTSHQDEDPRRKSEAVFLDQDKIEDGGFGMASQYTGSIQDHRSLRELREAIAGKGASRARGIAGRVRQARGRSANSDGSKWRHAGRLLYQRGLLEMYEGHFPEATASFQKSLGDRPFCGRSVAGAGST